MNMSSRINQIRKKYKLAIENFLYKKRYGKEIDFDNYVFRENRFSKRRLNIIYLTYFDSTFSLNNAYLPLCEIGKVFKFELNPNDDRRNWYKVKKQVNRDMVKFAVDTARDNRIDVIVCYLSGLSTTPEALRELRKLHIPMVNECLDDERKFISRTGKDGIKRGMKEVCRYFDLCLTTSRSAIVKYLVEGGRPMYKPYAGNPHVYRRLGLEKEYDVAFVGARYGSRSDFIGYLQSRGINVHVKGEGWERGFASPEEMIEIYNKARIVLGFSGVGENDDICILKGRDFEVPLTGSMYLTQYHPELEEYFVPGRDLETYRTPEELLAKVQRYLADDEARERIAETGYRKCLSQYTARQSYEKVFGHLGL